MEESDWNCSRYQLEELCNETYQADTDCPWPSIQSKGEVVELLRDSCLIHEGFNMFEQGAVDVSLSNRSGCSIYIYYIYIYYIYNK